MTEHSRSGSFKSSPDITKVVDHLDGAEQTRATLNTRPHPHPAVTTIQVGDEATGRPVRLVMPARIAEYLA